MKKLHKTTNALFLATTMFITTCSEHDIAIPEIANNVNNCQEKISSKGLISIGEGEYKLRVELFNEHHIFGGDILLAPWQVEYIKLREQSEELKAYGKFCILWTNHAVPFELDKSLSVTQKKEIENAINQWNKKCDVKFTPKKNEADFIVFSNNYCRKTLSYIGKISGKQEIWVNEGASTANVLHSMGHTIGLWNEHQRPNRGNFIQINWENVKDNCISYFDVNIIDKTPKDNSCFDFNSIMLPPSHSFSAAKEISLPIMEKKGAGEIWRNNNTLSIKDIECIHKMYTENID